MLGTACSQVEDNTHAAKGWRAAKYKVNCYRFVYSTVYVLVDPALCPCARTQGLRYSDFKGVKPVSHIFGMSGM